MSADRDSYWVSTRQTLLGRLKDWQNGESWREFVDTYGKLIHSVATRAGLSHEEADDVVQETILSVAKTIRSYRYDPGVTFRGWLKHLTKCRIADQFRSRPRERLLGDVVQRELRDSRSPHDPPDAGDSDLESIWDEEWRANVRNAALAKLKSRVSTKQFQVFYLQLVKGKTAADVAKEMGGQRRLRAPDELPREAVVQKAADERRVEPERLNQMLRAH